MPADSSTSEQTMRGVRAERDRLLREVLFLRTGQVVGAGGDDVDLATRVAAQHQGEAKAVRVDLAKTLEMVQRLQADAESEQQRMASLSAKIDELTARLQAANAQIAEMHASNSWRVTAPLRALTDALRRR